VFAFAVIVIGSLTPGYSQWSDPVSRLASPGEPCALEARAAFAAYGLLVVAGASTLRQYAGHQGHGLACCLTLYGVACVVAGVASKDQPGAALLTGLAAGIFRLTWGTPSYGLSERVLLGLGMGWISALATTAFVASARHAPAG
jgi:hypothetical protein